MNRGIESMNYLMLAGVAVGFAMSAAVLAQDPESEPRLVAVDTLLTALPAFSGIDGSFTLATDELDDLDEPQDAAAASNPLSSTSNLDIRLDYFDLDGSKDRFDINLRGGVMLHPRLKLAYEVHYWSTNITGTTKDNWERLVLRPIFFVDDVKLSERWGMRIATGVELSIDADNADEGIGSGSDQIAPLFGLAFNNRESKLTLIPFVQHFLSYDGPSVNITAFRLIALKPLPDSMWLRLDAKLPFDWANDTVPASLEVELGKMLGSWGVYGTGFFGIGGDRLYDWGVGTGIRFTF